MIPRVAHFVFGLRNEPEPLHFLHYASLESCRRVLEPEIIYLHHKHLPWGPWWERIKPHVIPVEADHVPEVLGADYLPDRVPERYRYAHHADFLRLDALIRYGGVYADIDTIFLRPFPEELFNAPFVIGREPSVRDERTGELRPSLCNALMMGERDAHFARLWRQQMAAALDGTWSNHSGFLSEELSRRFPDDVHVEPEVSFFPFPPNADGLSNLLEDRVSIPERALSVHLWAHLWWEYGRRDFSPAHAGWFTPPLLRTVGSTLADMVKPYLTEPPASVRPARSASAAPAGAALTQHSWSYLSLDEDSGYGIAARRCMAGLAESGLELEWIPFVRGPRWQLGYEPAPGRELTGEPDVVVAHLVPEYFPMVRERTRGAFLVGHTVWDTDRIPAHWIPCLDEPDLVVVPSNFSAEAIRASTVDAPVEIVPHAAPLVSESACLTWREPPADVFVFYTIGDWTVRKAIDRVVEAYLRAFSGRDQVLLIVKTSPRDFTRASEGGRYAGKGTSAWSLAALLARHRDPPAIKLITRPFTGGEVTALHRRGNCYVSLARGEGFALGAFDAAAHGNPVVMTGFGGQLDYLHGSPCLVGFDLVPVMDQAGFPSYAPDQHWAEPDVDHAASLMRQVAGDPDDAAAAFEPIVETIRANHGPRAIGEMFQAAVARHRSQRAAASRAGQGS
jgi:Glycosyltransferase sugar-binding region containing DXD motif